MNVFLLNYDEACGTEKEVLKILDRLPEILNWSTCLPFSVFVVADSNAAVLARKLGKLFGGGWFVLAEVNGQLDGMLPNDMWTFINDPKEAD